MIAIVNVPKGSAYAHLNGKEFGFNWVEVYSNVQGKLIFPLYGIYYNDYSRKVDFSQDELLFKNRSHE